MNQSKKVIYKEELELHLTNLKVENKEVNEEGVILVNVQPGEEDFVVLKTINKAEKTSFQMAFGYQFEEI